MNKKAHPLAVYFKGPDSVTKLAERAGVSRVHVYRVMKGENVTLDILQRIAAQTEGGVTVGAMADAAHIAQPASKAIPSEQVAS